MVKRIMVWVFLVMFALAPRFVLAEDKGLHLGGLEKDAKKAKIETKKAEQDLEKAKKKAEKEAAKAKKEAEKKAKQAQKELEKKAKEAKKALKK